jgi:hypothetical protein
MRAKFNSNDDKDEALFLVQNAQKAILSWKAHQLRTINQDRAKLDVLALIDSEDVLIVQDFAMKFMSSQYREAQGDSLASVEYHGMYPFVAGRSMAS